MKECDKRISHMNNLSSFPIR